jgi:hypothetical protein
LQCCWTCTHSGMDPCYKLPLPPYFNSHGFAFLLTVKCSTVIGDMVLISALAREPGRGLMRVPRGPTNVFQSLRSCARVIEFTIQPAVNPGAFSSFGMPRPIAQWLGLPAPAGMGFFASGWPSQVASCPDKATSVKDG